MYPYRSPYPGDQRFIGFLGWPLAIGGLSFLGGLLGGGLGASFATRPLYGYPGGYGYPPPVGYPPVGYPPVGYPPPGYPGYY
ncbi:hypothetical protein [Neobacillus sp.]|uniref:hypothetical protein n=1 Tax=Neobacillus sp. TaxID=2675273 RepID=UPI0028965A16|nr:hypothetical protein [Neobacillus sp.]